MRLKGIKQYKKENTVLIISWVIITLSLSLCFNQWWVRAAVFVITSFLYFLINSKLEYKNIDSILHIDLDAKRYFNELADNPKYSMKNGRYVAACWTVGNLQKIISSLEEESIMATGRYKYACINTLQYLYFETNDREKLKETHERVVALKGSDSGFFSHYINSDYAGCLCECDKIESLLNKKSKSLLLRIRLDFMRAVVLNNMGEKEKAKSLFESIVQKAPNVHYADLSKNYLTATVTGDGQYIATEALLSDRYQVGEVTINKKHNIFRTVAVWMLLMAAIIGVVFAFLKLDTPNSSTSNSTIDEEQYIYFTVLNDYLDDCFENYEVLYIFALEYEDILLVESEGSLNIISFVFKSVQETSMSIYASDIWFEQEYTVYSSYYDMTISFSITEAYIYVPYDAFFVEKIKFYGKDYYFSISEYKTYEQEYNEAFSEVMSDEFGEYEILHLYHFDTTDIYLVESDGKIDIFGFWFEITEWNSAQYSWKTYESDIDLENTYSISYDKLEKCLGFLISEAEIDESPDILALEKIEIDGKEYFYCIKELPFSNEK